MSELSRQSQPSRAALGRTADAAQMLQGVDELGQGAQTRRGTLFRQPLCQLAGGGKWGQRGPQSRPSGDSGGEPSLANIPFSSASMAWSSEHLTLAACAN